MKGYAIIKTGEHGWIETDEPVAGPLDAICKPLQLHLAPQTLTQCTPVWVQQDHS